MKLPKNILKTPEVLAPCVVALRQKIFDGVAEAFQSDAQPVTGDSAAVPESLAVKLIGCMPALESELLINRILRRHGMRSC
jgi:hypothetical protein